jgi:hypothetical protein
VEAAASVAHIKTLSGNTLRVAMGLCLDWHKRGILLSVSLKKATESQDSVAFLMIIIGNFIQRGFTSYVYFFTSTYKKGGAQKGLINVD